MSNPVAILNGDQIYLDELIRENARLTLQHRADHDTILALSDRVEQLEAEEPNVQQALEACGCAQNRARIAEAKLEKSEAMLRKALADLHYVMAGGDPCRVCTVKCAFGEGNCKPVWVGEEKEEAADQ